MKIKPIPNFPDYLISDTGIVYSIAKRANRGRPRNPIIKSQSKCFGYYIVYIQKNGEPYKKFVHRLILETFVGKCPNGMQCRHLDGNPLNNNLNNLKWGTRSENQMDRLINGKDNRGEKHGMSKLTKSDVLEIRKLADLNIKTFIHKRKKDLGSGYKEIAKKFKVCPSTIGHIVRNSTWKWL